MLLTVSLAVFGCAGRCRWLAHCAWVGFAFCALGCSEKAATEPPITGVNAASAPLDIPTTDASTLLREVSQTHARMQVELMGFARSDQLTFGMVMISPKLKNDAIAALRSQRAFEIIRAGLSVARNSVGPTKH